MYMLGKYSPCRCCIQMPKCGTLTLPNCIRKTTTSQGASGPSFFFKKKKAKTVAYDNDGSKKKMKIRWVDLGPLLY